MEPTYLIIGGTAKAGTSSVFNYLGDHPEVCASYMKETGFFLDPDYSFSQIRDYRFEDGLDKYQLFFAHCRGERNRLEATHAYLYSPGTPERIKASLPKVKLLFLVRDPIDRLISFYRYAKQYDPSLPSMAFDEFVQMQLSDNKWAGSRGLAGGCYSIYLRRYLDIFPRSDICILQFEMLKRNARSLVERICHFASIRSEYYEGYQFHVYNRTQTIRYAALHRLYSALRRRTSRRRILGLRGGKPAVPSLRLRLEQIYYWLNSIDDEKVAIPAALQAQLEEYYEDEPAAMTELLDGEPLLWTFCKSA